MKVYIVIEEIPYDVTNIIDVFDSEEKAQKFINDKIGKVNFYIDDREVK
jgi:hypothetical protein